VREDERSPISGGRDVNRLCSRSSRCSMDKIPISGGTDGSRFLLSNSSVKHGANVLNRNSAAGSACKPLLVRLSVPQRKEAEDPFARHRLSIAKMASSLEAERGLASIKRGRLHLRATTKKKKFLEGPTLSYNSARGEKDAPLCKVPCVIRTRIPFCCCLYPNP